MKAPESEETIELCHFPASGPVKVQPDLTHLAFEVDSLEEFGKHLASSGLRAIRTARISGPTAAALRLWTRRKVTKLN